jgi:arylsulfatase A-like enzyme
MEATMSRLRTAFALAGTVLLGCGVMAAMPSSAQASCSLQSKDSRIKYVVYITFDNVHLRRDNPNMPSDLELMPNLLNFLLDNGTVSGNNHTPLISHTANDILTALTGVYPDRHGIAVANSYGFFRQDGSVGFSSAFLYWTSPSNGTVANGDGLPNMLNENGKTAPAPWVPFTRAGCDVGAFSVANIEFESVPNDLRTFFGPNSTQFNNANNILLANPNDANFAHQKARQSVNTDWLGIAIHCAQDSALCANGGAPDLLPDEPGSYNNFNALFGNVNVAPAICAKATPHNPSACAVSSVTNLPAVQDVFGTTIIADAFGRPGFPNTFDPTAAQSLGYAATMLEAGIPVVYLYIADVHDRNPLPVDPVTGFAANSHAFGPGEAEYVSQAKAYDAAFGAFFARLKKDGITKDNTLFVVVPDENDHFVGSQPTPTHCDGVRVPCNYVFASEINAIMNRLLITQDAATPPFLVHNDDAPTIYISGNPGQHDPKVRAMAHDLDALTATNPITTSVDKLSFLLADQQEMSMLHMVTKSPARTPTLTMFGNDNYFFFNSGSGNCLSGPPCISEPTSGSTFAWNHGDVQEDITRTWMGMVGPGVRQQGRDDSVFSDHTDMRPTMMALLGLKDDYVHDGRVLAEKLDESAMPHGIRDSKNDFLRACGDLQAAQRTAWISRHERLIFANRSIVSDDTTYNQYLATLGPIVAARDALAAQIKTVLDDASFADKRIDHEQADSLVRQARRIIDQVADLAGTEHDGGHEHHDDR